MESEEITKRELERWKNVENIEEIPLEALRAMYLDLKANSVPRQKIEDKIKEIEIAGSQINGNYYNGNIEIKVLQELLEKR